MWCVGVLVLLCGVLVFWKEPSQTHLTEVPHLSGARPPDGAERGAAGGQPTPATHAVLTVWKRGRGVPMKYAASTKDRNLATGTGIQIPPSIVALSDSCREGCAYFASEHVAFCFDSLLNNRAQCLTSILRVALAFPWGCGAWRLPFLVFAVHPFRLVF